jgi:hypothetical protein
MGSLSRIARFSPRQHHPRDVRRTCCTQGPSRFIQRGARGHHIVYQHHSLAAHRWYTFGRNPKRITHMVETFLA